MGKLKEEAKKLVHRGEIQEKGMKAMLESILLRSWYSISVEDIIVEFKEKGIILTLDEIEWIKKQIPSSSPVILEDIDDDDVFFSYEQSFKIEEQNTDHTLKNNKFLEVINQDFNEITNNYGVNDDTDEQIEAIIQELKDW